MNYKIKSIAPFDSQLKWLSKKYPSLKKEMALLIESLSQEPKQGIDLGKNCYKIRLSVASKGKGKSGGARVITLVRVVGETVYLLSIFDKSDQTSISESDLTQLLKRLPD
ncbi:MAG: type II toxin-antitoxin system RelE/ParE family toxin [Bacteroidia bacterium]